MFWQRRKAQEQDLDREIQSHLELEAEEQQENGVPPDEARYAARRVLGNTTAIKEDTRAVWQWVTFEQLLQDLRYGLRGLRNNSAFTATAVLSLALGIGANTAIFSLIDALMLRWLPVHDPQTLVQLRFQAKGDKGPGESFSYAIVRALAEQKDIFASVAGFSGWEFKTGHAGSINKVPGAMVTGAYYETLGLNPVVGRLLTAEDDQRGAPLVAVLSYGYWERNFARNPAVIGQTIHLNGVPVTIIGVSPPRFVGANVGSVAEITMPVAALPSVSPDMAALLGQGNFWLRILARPKSGVLPPEAKARLAAVWPQISERVLRPDWPPARKKAMTEAIFELVPGGTGWTYLRTVFQKPLLVLMAVVALVLVIACANVANLLLARAAVRQREIAVRLAIGAGRGRIIRQLLTESILLSTFGAALGVGLAWLTGRLLLDVLSSGSQQVIFDLTPNWNVLTFTTAVAIAMGILFGLAPAFQATAMGPSPALKEDSRMSHSRLISSLVTVQVALALVLLIGAGLFVRTLQNLENLDPGFKREGVLLVALEGRRTAFPTELLDELQRIPGVLSASVSTHTPLNGSTWSEPAVPNGQPVPEKDNAYFVGAGPRFFETLQTPLVAGREFTERDSVAAPKVAIVNEAFALRYFPSGNAVGQHLSAVVRGQPADLEIVGAVQNAGLAGLRKAAPPAVYVAYYQLPTRNEAGKFTSDFPTTLEIRASGSLSQVASAIRSQLQSRLPNEPIEVRPLSKQVEAALVQERLLAMLAGIFGVLALILAFIGLYGLLAYGVARRTREIGIRMALGAQRTGVIVIVVKRAFVLVVLGIALGVPAALAASRWVQSMLFGLKPTDPTTIVEAVLLLTAAALVAAYLPARRAAKIDPMVALRHE